jgi:hypothetical protein
MVRRRGSKLPSRCVGGGERECNVCAGLIRVGMCAQLLGEDWRSKHLPHHANNPSLLLPPYL